MAIAGVALVAGGAALWGLDGVLRAPLAGGWRSSTLVLFEHLLLTAAVLPWLLRGRASLRALSRDGWIAVFAVAWGGSALATLAFTSAFQAGNPIVVVLLQKTQPLWAMAAAAVVVGERPRRELALVAIAALAGSYLLSFGWTAPADALGGPRLRGVVLALAAAALWGSATAFGRRALRELPPATLTSARVTLALPALGVIAAAQGALAPPPGATGGHWLRLLLLALLPGLLALVLYYRGLRTTPAPVATLAELAFPATSLLTGYVFLDVRLTAGQAAGFAIVWLAIARLHARRPWVARRRSPHPEPAPA